jgi:hypothetical protein
MAREKKPVVEWFDRGRDRWRAPPAKKERSYDEAVYRRPASWPREGWARRLQRAALRAFVADRDEGRLDRSLGETRERHSLRDSRATLRRDHVARQFEWHAHAVLRQANAGRHYYAPTYCVRCDEHERERDWSRRWSLREALVSAALEVHFARHEGPLFEHPTFITHIARSGQRKLVARRLLRWIADHTGVPVGDRVRRTLVSFADSDPARVRDKPFFQWFAMRLAFVLGWFEQGYARGLYDSFAARRRERERLLVRALERDPALRERVEAWVLAVLPDPREADRLARSVDERRRY